MAPRKKYRKARRKWERKPKEVVPEAKVKQPKVINGTEVKVTAHGPVRMVFTDLILHQVEMLGLMGATDKQIGEFFKVSVDTILRWKRDYPEFKEARQRGGMHADMEVAQSLFKRATGFEYKEEQFFRVGRKLVKKKVKKLVVPDVKAALAWLAARQREQWTQTSRVAHSGTIEHKHINIEEIPVEELSKDAQDMLFEVAQKQLTTGQRDN